MKRKGWEYRNERPDEDGLATDKPYRGTTAFHLFADTSTGIAPDIKTDLGGASNNRVLGKIENQITSTSYVLPIHPTVFVGPSVLLPNTELVVFLCCVWV